MSACFVLIPGAGTAASAFDLTAATLREHGHEAVAVELPCADPDAALPQYTAAARAAVGERRELVVVGQSIGAFTAAQLAAESDARLLVLLCPMIPLPGETPGEWWRASGHDEASAHLPPASEWDEETTNAIFLNDATPDVVAAAGRHLREQSGGIFAQPLALDSWPDVETRVLVGTDDRFFPLDFQRRVARERLGLEPDVMPGDHCPMISRPVELAERLLQYL